MHSHCQLFLLCLLLASAADHGCLEYLNIGKKHILCEEYDSSFSFDKLPSDTSVLLIKNQKIETVRNGYFSNFYQLESLSLTGNRMRNIEENSFSGLAKLTRLDLSNNSLSFASGIPEDIFKGLGSLKELDLSNNPLGKIKWINLKGLRYGGLTHLNISNSNQYEPLELTEKVLSGFSFLEVLDMSHSGLARINLEEDIKQMKNLKEFLIEGNPLICDCRLLWLKELLKQNQMLKISNSYRKGSQSQYPKCNGPPMYRGKYAFLGPIGSEHELLSEENFGCPPEMTSDSSLVNTEAFSNVSIKCTALSDSSTKVVWLKDGRKIERSYGRFNIKNYNQTKDYRSFFEITEIQPEDSGIYRCEFTNEFGSSSNDFNITINPNSPAFHYRTKQTFLVVTLIILGILICLVISTILICVLHFKKNCSFQGPWRNKKNLWINISKDQCLKFSRKEKLDATTKNIVENAREESALNLLEVKTHPITPNNIIYNQKTDTGANQLNNCLYVSCDGPEPKLYMAQENKNLIIPSNNSNYVTISSLDKLLSPAVSVKNSRVTSSISSYEQQGKALYATISYPHCKKKPCPLHGTVNVSTSSSYRDSCPVHGENASQTSEVKLKSSLKSPKATYPENVSSKEKKNVPRNTETSARGRNRSTTGVSFKPIIETSTSYSSSMNSSLSDSSGYQDKKIEREYEFYLDRLSKYSQLSLNKPLSSSNSQLQRRSSIANMTVKAKIYPIDRKDSLSKSQNNLNQYLIGTPIILDRESSIKRASSSANMNECNLLRAGSKHKLMLESDHSSVD